MKRNIFKIVSFLTAAALLTSCEKSFLDTTPSSSISPTTVFSTVELAEGAINGINKLMTTQHGGDYGQGFNGEGTIKLWYGEYPGNNFSKPYMTGWSVIFNQQYHERTSSVYDSYPWYYYYRIIANANMILENIDGAAGSPTRRDFVKAQALTFRAYAYTMLIQIYSKRWMDYQGDTPGVVLRLTSSTEDLPLSTQAQIYDQIYVDLDQAIGLYTSSGEERTNGYDPDINVAYATYARAALTRQDYPNALKYAKLARVGYPLMTNSEYVTGAFAAPNQEWIWYSYGAPDETLYYYSYQAYIAYNANSSAGRSYRSCISKQLFDSIPNGDIRKNLFINPSMWADQDPVADGYQNSYFSQDWNYKSSANVNQSYYIITNATMANEVRNYISAKFPYARSENGYINVYEHCKIGSVEAPGVGCMNHFRSSEMILIEAECDYALGDPTGAQNALIELNKTSGRNPSYACTLTGTRLFEEIVKYRGLELWGEGFDWFDYKRWGRSISRKSIAAGSNFHTMMAITVGPSEDNEWTWMIPQAETDYNTALE